MSDGLKRTLGLGDLILIVIGTVIGSGIFLVPGPVLSQSQGSVSISLLVWTVGGVLSLLGALTYGELGASRPSAGGLYVYIRDAFGELPAFLYGWTMFFIMGAGSCATLAVAFTRYFGQFVAVSPLVGKIIAILMIAAVMVINVRGTRGSANVQNLTTALKVGGILVMSVLLLTIGRSTAPAAAAPAGAQMSLLTGIGLAMISVLWAYEGWQYATFSAGETRDVQRTFPRGIVLGTAAIIVIYVVANMAYVAALGATRAASSERIAAEAMSTAFGPAAGNLIAAIILVSMFSATNGLVLTSPRLYYSMANDGVFFKKLAEVHPKFGTPAIAIVATCVWAMILAATGTFERLLTYVVFVGWVFYALGAMAIFVYRRREPNAERPFRTPGYPVTPVLFILSALAIVGNTIMQQPGLAVRGLGMVAIGIPAYYVWRSKRAAAAKTEPERAQKVS